MHSSDFFGRAPPIHRSANQFDPFYAVADTDEGHRHWREGRPLLTTLWTWFGPSQRRTSRIATTLALLEAVRRKAVAAPFARPPHRPGVRKARSAQEIFNPFANDVRYRGKVSYTKS